MIKLLHKIKAADFITSRHYSPVMPSLTRYYCGYFVKEELQGVITFGYGVSLVAGLMGHVYLLLAYFKPKDKQLLDKVFNNTYGLTLMGLFFTMFGTILGGIWADQSWGRFWGWDPKENGALLIVLWHLMVLHLRISGLIKPLGYAYAISLVNIVVAIAWFGVNLLNVGLHSYGFTDNVATNLILFIVFELVFTSSFYYLVKKKTTVSI